MHLRNLLSFALPLALIFLLAYALARWGLIPLYHFQVPTSHGPATNPQVGPTLILILLGGAFFVALPALPGLSRPRESRAATEMARLCVGFLSLLVGLGPDALALAVPAAALPGAGLGLAAGHLLRRAGLLRARSGGTASSATPRCCCSA